MIDFIFSLALTNVIRVQSTICILEDKDHMLGKAGEDYAAAYLELNDYSILERNWRCTLGEADIIAIHQDDLVVVEVKTRHGKDAEEKAIQAITPSKKQKLFVLAEVYHAQSDLAHLGIRVDVVAVGVIDGSATCELYQDILAW